MKVLVAIPVMGQFEIGRISLYQWDRTASSGCRFLLIDNSGANSPYPALFNRGFLDGSTLPEGHRWHYYDVGENVGLVRSCQIAYEYADRHDFDILVLTHNDVWVYPESVGEHDFGGCGYWDECVSSEFAAKFDADGQSLGELGVVGLFGSKGCGSEGHRLDTFGSLIEMAGHGRRMTQWIEPAVCLDGFFLVCGMKMLREAQYGQKCETCHGCITTGLLACKNCYGSGKCEQHGGFDQRYQMHHVYDYDISLTSIELGYRNAVLNIPCHHLSGLTANNDAYSTSGPEVHHANYQLWLEKWHSKLGITVDENWNYRWWGVGK